MQTEHVGRYIGLATPSVPDERDSPTLKAKILPVVAGLLFPNALNELVGMTAAVTQSDLDWTIARITRPTRGRPKGTVCAGFLGRDKVGSAMSRADIATFLVAQLTDTTLSRAAPAISN
jgi:NAD(P)H-binding